MAFDIGSLVGGNIADAVAKIVSLFKIDPTVALQNRTEIEKIQLELQQQLITQVGQQIDVDKVEAAGSSWLDHWRAGAGWTCVAGLAIQYIISPLATWGASLAGHAIKFPTLDTMSLNTLLFGMLGLGGYHMYEGIKTAQNGNGNGN